ncbi:MAG: YbjQ family protein [Actinomycetota bacterium]|nr:YbjQ family protein [Actinomycetota bacterium]
MGSGQYGDSPDLDEDRPAGGSVADFPITTALEFPEWPIDASLGMVYGLIVRSIGLGRGITAGIRSLAGGEVRQYTRLVEDSRRQAVDRMIENARILGANGIVSMRFDASEMGQGLTEIVAYGSAVRLGARR